ncbi:concanavalin A-like lectin/glucanase domain-containing protein, partial [Bisporella sp. PMI_857]
DLPKLNSSDCTCFRTEISNSSSFNFWNYYKFWDFRNISTNEALSIPDILNGELGTANAGLTSDYFNSDAFALDWAVQNWNNSATQDDILMINSQNNLYIERYSHSSPDVNTFMTLRTTRQPAFQSAAEIVSKQANFRYLSIRFKARVIGSSGACAGLFTYRENDNVVNEIDFEFLTQGPRNMVHFTNQGGGAETFNYSFPQGLMSDWRVYRMDWDQLSSRWWLGGEQVKLFQRGVPKSPSRLNVNIWSNGGAWSGNMDPYEQAFFQIQWIEVAFNTSGPDNAS